MKTDPAAGAKPSAAPSADFVRKISDLLDTDPSDLLNELGYYDRTKRHASPPATAAVSGADTTR